MQLYFLTFIGIGNWIEIFGAVLVTIGAVIPPAWEVIEAKFTQKYDCKPPTIKACKPQTFPGGEP